MLKAKGDLTVICEGESGAAGEVAWFMQMCNDVQICGQRFLRET